MVMVSSPYPGDIFSCPTFEYWRNKIKVFALLHAESFDEVPNVVEGNGHDSDVAGHEG